MFLRTTKRKNNDGSLVEYLQLAHNARDPESRKPVAEIIHNFGRADKLDRDVLVRLCRSIARICNVEVVDHKTQNAEGHSGQKQLWPDDVKLIRSRVLGTVHVIEALWERLGIGPLLRKIITEEGCQAAYERALFAMTANRLCEPKSKLGVWDRWLPEVYLPSCWELKLDQLYESMDLLHRHSARMEEAIFFHTANLFNLDVDVVFYDTTTASFSIDFEDADLPTVDDTADGSAATVLRKRGRNKEGTWKPQIVVALAVTREGIPVRSWVFSGDTSDVTTVETVKKDLQGWKLNRCLFVADAGMNSEENKKILALGAGKYLLAVRAGSVKEVKEDVLIRPGRYKVVADNLQVKEVKVGEGVLHRRYFVCFNPKEAERQKLHRQEVIKFLHEELSKHKEWNATAKWAVELLASQRTRRYLSTNEEGQIYVDPIKAKAMEKFDGKWVLITNDDTLRPEDAASGYKNLLVIEQCFRTLKNTQIHLTPMNHWLSHRIEAHVKICVLALWIQRVAEHTCGKTWNWLRYTFAQLQATEFRTPSHQFFRRNEPPQEVAALLKTLNIPMPKPTLDIIPHPAKL
jgi:Transposase